VGVEDAEQEGRAINKQPNPKINKISVDVSRFFIRLSASDKGGPTAPSSAAATEAAKPPREQSAGASCWAAYHFYLLTSNNSPFVRNDCPY